MFLIALPLGLERPDLSKIAGLALGMSGAAVVIFERAGDLGQSTIGGDAKILIAVVAWAAYTVLGKPLVAEFGAVAATSWALSFGTILFLPFGIPPLLHFPLASLTPVAWGSLAFLIVMTSVISYLCWYYAVGKLDPSRAAIFANVQPVITATAMWALYGAPITTPLVVGGALVICGVFVTTRVGYRPSAEAATE